MILSLIGFMGCGKSTVARFIASESGCFYFDLDDTIEMEEGRSVSEIFSEDGEQAFRDLEYKYLSRILDDYEDFPVTMVLSLGGGTVTQQRCAELVKARTTCVYLRAGIDEIVHNLEITGIDNRPLLDGEAPLRQKVSALMEQRAAIYENCADWIIDVDNVPQSETAGKIIGHYEEIKN